MNNLKQTVSVFGGTGQVGTPLVRALLEQGHNVRLLTRARRPHNAAKFAAAEAAGARVVEADLSSESAVATALAGTDVVVAAVPGSVDILTRFEPVWIRAAVRAGVRRFVPTEFGSHTRALESGVGVVFDRKKQIHTLLEQSGLEWTLFYAGGFFDYFLPNLRLFRKITTFGDLDIPIYTHDVSDVGRVAALAATDPRTARKCVQMDYQALTQRRMLELLRSNWPDYPFEYEYYSAEYIKEARETAGDEVSAKAGAETDKERWGINYANYVLGGLAAFTEETLRATELYPDVAVISAESKLADKHFVFDEEL